MLFPARSSNSANGAINLPDRNDVMVPYALGSPYPGLINRLRIKPPVPVFRSSHEEEIAAPVLLLFFGLVCEKDEEPAISVPGNRGVARSAFGQVHECTAVPLPRCALIGVIHFLTGKMAISLSSGTTTDHYFHLHQSLPSELPTRDIIHRNNSR